MRLLPLLTLFLVPSFLLAAQPPRATFALNDIRAQAGLSGLALSPRLQAAAEAHARDMDRNNYFSHKSRSGKRASHRIKAQGYRYCMVAENIARGQTSLTQVMRDWVKSAGHRRNILSRKASQFGLARAGDVWVLVLARPGC